MIPNGTMTPVDLRLQSAIEQYHDAGRISRKSIQYAIDDSKTGTRRIFTGERPTYTSKFVDIISDRDIDLDVRLGIGNAALAGSGLRMEGAETPDRAQLRDAISSAVESVCASAELARQTVDSCADGVLTAEECARIQAHVAKVRSFCDSVDAITSAHTPRSQMRVG